MRVYLVNNGLSTFPITSEGKGESDPIASNLTVEGRSKNRRVEILVEDVVEVKKEVIEEDDGN